jgi:hypothetical protein
VLLIPKVPGRPDTRVDRHAVFSRGRPDSAMTRGSNDRNGGLRRSTMDFMEWRLWAEQYSCTRG